MKVEYREQLTENEREQVMGLEIFENGIENEETTEFYLALENGSVVGAMQIVGNLILNLQVKCGAPKGTGGALVRELQEYCDADGVKVRDAISEAVGFYQKMGFEVTRKDGVGQCDMVWWPE